MKNYLDSNYALNRYSENIVYRLVDGIVEVTLEDYLAENPDKTEDDFRTLKELSDAIYFEEDRSDYRQTWKNVSLYSLDDTGAHTTSSPEDEFIERTDQAARKEWWRELGFQAVAKLTEVQRRRYVQYHVEDLTIREIAEREGVSHVAVVYSLELAGKKIKKFLSISQK